MVLIGGVLEDHLLKLVNSRDLTWAGSGGISKYNELLRDVAYNQPVWRRIQSIGDLRNVAAHGTGEAISPGDVEDAKSFTQRFLADHSA